MMDSSKCSDIIDLSQTLLNELSDLYLSERASDVVFIVDGQRLFGHKFILMFRCHYFRLMFGSGLRESIRNEVEVNETSVDAFKSVLYYMYTGICHLNHQSVDDIIDILFLGHRYEMDELVAAITDYLALHINTDNVCLIHETASLFNIHSLTDKCRQYILSHGYLLLNQSSFLSLNLQTLVDLLSNDNFCAEEIDIFNAIMKYIEINPKCDEEVVEDLISTVRLHLICWNDLIAYVWPSGYFAREELLTTIDHSKPQEVTDNNDYNYRRCVQPIQTLDTVSAFIVEKTVLYYQKFESTLSVVQKIPGCVTIEFDSIRFANYLELDFGNCCRTGYSYYVEVSTGDNDDYKSWQRIADYTDYQCFSKQYLFFPKTAFKQMRLYCGSSLSGATNFIINDLKLMIKEFPKDSYNNSRNKSCIDYGSYNPNKCYAPLYGTHHDISSKAKRCPKSVL